MKNSCVILASGYSRRFHDNKLLYDIHHQPMILHLFETIKGVDYDSICVVTQYDQIREYASSYHYDVIINDHPDLGISHSIQLGVWHCYDSDTITFIVGDQPALKQKTLKRMLACFDGHIVSCLYQGVLHNPMLFPHCYFDELMMLEGENGGKKVALCHDVTVVEVDEYECQDIDTQEDLYHLIKKI